MLSLQPLRVHRMTCLKALLAFGLTTLLSFSVSAAQSVAVPDTPAGQALSALLDALNSGERERVVAYQQQYEPQNPGAVEGLLDFRRRTGGLDLQEIRKSEPSSIQFMVKDRNGLQAFGMLKVADTPPARVTTWVVRVVPPGAPIIGFDIDDATRKRVIDNAVAKLNELYVFPDTAKKMGQELRKKLARNEYTATNGDQFAFQLTQQLQAVSHDKHLRVMFSPSRLPDSRPDAPSAEEAANMRKSLERMNCGFEKVEHLPENIGYLKFNMFGNPADCGPTAVAAMNLLANVDAIIFDLRENGGGDPAMVAFLSTYLFDSPVHLNDIWTRETNSTQQFWTQVSVPGKRLPAVPAFVLTSNRTFSGAEDFSYNLKNLKRATLIGETTGGGAHPTRGERIDDRFTIFVPFARSISPITQTNWEGTGVEPDVKVAAAEALTTAQKLASEAIRTH